MEWNLVRHVKRKIQVQFGFLHYKTITLTALLFNELSISLQNLVLAEQTVSLTTFYSIQSLRVKTSMVSLIGSIYKKEPRRIIKNKFKNELCIQSLNILV